VDDPIVGYTDFVQESGETFATAQHASGATHRGPVRVSVEREHRSADGELIAAGEIASTDDGSVRVGGAA
jgi:hypothetical protein